MLYIRSVPKEFYKHGIFMLIDKENKVLGSDGVSVNDYNEYSKIKHNIDSNLIFD